MADESLAERLRQRILTDGPLPVSAYVDAALYDPEGGFYATDGRAGRRGDFLTAPEVGPLFGAVVARAVDAWWRDAGSPPSFHVQEWGAGPGTLARAVLAAEPEVLVAGALTWELVEISDAQRTQHPEHPAVRSVAAPAEGGADVVLANELLDNLPFDIAERTPTGWSSLAVDLAQEPDRFVLTAAAAELSGPDAVLLDDLAGEVPLGTRLPVAAAATAWLRDRLDASPGRLVVFDYGAPAAELAERDGGWLRTHRAHDGRRDWLTEPGSCDITIDVPIDALDRAVPGSRRSTQADWLRRHGIDDLVEEGRARWTASAGVGDLAALTARSRIREAEALLDPDGMGAFVVLEWEG